jgi:two-component system KDP operon response regulator KdpE
MKSRHVVADLVALCARVTRSRTRADATTADGRPSPSKPTVGRVLVIEDDVATRRAISEGLRDHDFDVISAQDGYLGLRLAAIGRPDLIVLDLGLPVLDGRSFLAQLRKCSNITCVPVVVVSARPDARLTLGEAGAAAFLGKPVDLPTLVGVIRTLLLRPPASFPGAA